MEEEHQLGFGVLIMGLEGSGAQMVSKQRENLAEEKNPTILCQLKYIG